MTTTDKEYEEIFSTVTHIILGEFILSLIPIFAAAAGWWNVAAVGLIVCILPILLAMAFLLTVIAFTLGEIIAQQQNGEDTTPEGSGR